MIQKRALPTTRRLIALFIIFSHEMIATINTRSTLSVAIIDLLRRYHQMKQSDIVYWSSCVVRRSAIIGKNVDHLTKNCGRHYSGSTERIVSGAL